MFKQWLLALCVSGFALSACAAPDGTAAGQQSTTTGAESTVRKAVMSFAPKVTIDSVKPAPFPGFYEVIASGQLVFVSNDGKYMLQAPLYDFAAKKDVGEPVLASVRRDLLKRIPESDRIVFAAPVPRHTVVVFTDVECGFCRKFHSEIADYNKAGITVEYLAFPRAGIGSPDYDKMVSVWCAPDRRKALTDAKNDRPIARRACTNPVADEYRLGQRAGLEGTPMILAEDGSVLGGYVSPEELRVALDELDAGQAPVASTATGGM